MSGKKKKAGGQRRARRKKHPPLWRRTVLVPLALALGIAVALLILQFWRPSRPPFDGSESFNFLREFAKLGPRTPGSPTHDSAESWLVSRLESFADQVSRQAVTAPVSGDTLVGTNLIASFNLEPARNIRVMLSTHWDSRPWADRDPDSAAHRQPMPGVNDGGSGVAVLLEIARVLDEHPPDIGVDLLFFDLEDSGTDPTVAFALGSEFFAANSPHYRPTFGINVDMVCDRDLEIPREGNSVRAARRIVDLVWDAADREGAGAFVDRVGRPVMDDHVPFLQRGIPVINLIQSPFPSYWHTRDDTIDNCSPSSLQQVGDVLLRVIHSQ